MQSSPQDLEESVPPPLPLGWTRVQRGTKRSRESMGGGSSSADSTNKDDPLCCEDPSCLRRVRRLPQVPGKLLRTTEEHNSETSTSEESAAKPIPSTAGQPGHRVEGTVIMCLHEPNADWFQGYFFPALSSKPWGLLAIQEEVDECLQCEEGGYRVLSITVNRFESTVLDSSDRRKIKYKQVDWTGGDMMQLEGEGLSMKADQLLTGSKSLPYLERMFAKLVRTLQEDGRQDEQSEALAPLDVIPDVAIIRGSMTVVLPSSQDET